jgi:signal transduction histidine kinase/ActR/RegA family two-component response regulator
MAGNGLADEFMPHGQCFLWQSSVLWLHVGSDVFIASAYYIISISLFYFLYKRADIPFKWMFVLFGLFIFACGTTHVMEVVTIWFPAYWTEGWVKFMTASVSFSTGMLLIPLIPKAMALRSPMELEALNAHLHSVLDERDRAFRTLEASQQELLKRKDELVHHQRQLQHVSSQLILTEQRERRRLATDLHDCLAQLLVVAHLKVSHAMSRACEDTLDALLDLRNLLDRSLKYTRTLVSDLNPIALSHSSFAGVLDQLATEMHRHGLFVQVVCPDRALQLTEDQTILIHQIVRELLFNVLKHAGVNLAVVSVAKAEEIVLITVEDHGRGFDVASSNRLISGTFGLASVRQRLDALGGEMMIDSVVGQGTRATLQIPLEKAVPVPPVRLSTTKPPLLPTDHFSDPQRIIRILVVDDHALVRQGILSLLAQYLDVQVVGEAASGQEALDQCQRSQPDIVLMDMNMPGMNGIEATWQITRAFPRVKVIGLSVNEEAHTIEAMKAAGAIDFVSKASVAESLYEAVRGCHSHRNELEHP